MNKPNIPEVQDLQSVDLASWWAELRKAIDLLADFDFLAQHNPTKLTKTSTSYIVSLYKDRIDGELYASKEITKLSNGNIKVTVEIGQKREIWQISKSGDTLRKEKVNA